MTSATDRLWGLNNAYRRNLKQAERCLGLLEILLHDRIPAHEQSDLLALLYDLRQQIMRLNEDLRGWRYTYYYQSPFHKRMVADEHEIDRALLYFGRLRSRHQRLLTTALQPFHALPTPAPALTSVEITDLWQCTVVAITELYAFVTSQA
jgi:hypothetical protein